MTDRDDTPYPVVQLLEAKMSQGMHRFTTKWQAIYDRVCAQADGATVARLRTAYRVASMRALYAEALELLDEEEAEPAPPPMATATSLQTMATPSYGSTHATATGVVSVGSTNE